MRCLWAVRRDPRACVTISPGAETRATAADSAAVAAAPEAVDPSRRALYAGTTDAGRPGEKGSIEPMSGFDKREEGFERKFALDEELRFKAMARRNKYLGLWAAEKLGLSGAEAETYAKSVVMADFDEPGEDDVYRKVRADFDAKGVKVTDAELRGAMNELLAKAVEEIKTGK
jgi:hypothetical protein